MSTSYISPVVLVDETLYGKKFVPVQSKLSYKGPVSMTFDDFESMLYHMLTTDADAWDTSVRTPWVDRWGKTVDTRNNAMTDFFTDFTSLLHDVVNFKNFRNVTVNVSGKTMVNWDRVYAQALIKFDKVMGNVESPLNKSDLLTLRSYFSDFVLQLSKWTCFVQTKSGSLKTYYTNRKLAVVQKYARYMSEYMRMVLLDRYEVTHEVVRKATTTPTYTTVTTSKSKKRSMEDEETREVDSEPSSKKSRRRPITV